MKKSKIKYFNQSTSYRKFVHARDEALESILRNNRLRTADRLNQAFNNVLELVRRDFRLLSEQYHPTPIKYRLGSFENKVNEIFEKAALSIAILIFTQRKRAYMLAHVGEAEALGQTLALKLKVEATKHDIDHWAYSEPFADKQQVLSKIDNYFSRLRRSLMNEIELSIALMEPIEKMMGRLIKKLPRRRQIDQGRKLTKMPKRIKEAAKPIDFQFIDDETWRGVVDDYLNEYVVTNRSPAAVFDALNPFNDEPIREDIPSEEAFYEWEIEKDATHDFVKQVRDGTVDAANKNGITDFVVIAILDDRTCESCCGEDLGCVEFNGKLTSEIEEMTDGEYDVPPFHFNCRCTLAPVTDDLEAYDISPTEKEFDEWLRPNG